jgi:hypothetical protein
VRYVLGKTVGIYADTFFNQTDELISSSGGQKIELVRSAHNKVLRIRPYSKFPTRYRERIPYVRIQINIFVRPSFGRWVEQKARFEEMKDDSSRTYTFYCIY